MLRPRGKRLKLDEAKVDLRRADFDAVLTRRELNLHRREVGKTLSLSVARRVEVLSEGAVPRKIVVADLARNTGSDGASGDERNALLVGFSSKMGVEVARRVEEATTVVAGQGSGGREDGVGHGAGEGTERERRERTNEGEG
jgi:hypothetical protein